jgi:hypothetical protein
LTAESGKLSSTAYRCKVCGIQSNEPSCFSGVRRQVQPQVALTCVGCLLLKSRPDNLRNLFRTFYVIFIPLFFVHNFSGSKLSGVRSVVPLLAARFMLSSLIILHELGH